MKTGASRILRGQLSDFSKRLFLNILLGALVVWAVPAASFAQECETCIPCHGNLAEVHGEFNHTAAPPSKTIAIFPDDGHDSSGWEGEKPYFGVLTDCVTCHDSQLPAAHGDDCATCHPTPYDSLGVWGKGCQQGSCHPFYHQDVFKSHDPFANPFDPENDCSRCHSQDFSVAQTNCLSCHASYGDGDITPPTTTTNALAEYIGPARIGFSIEDNGKVGVGRTFYSLDGGAVTASGKYLFIDSPGSHTLEYWSKDQSGNTEQTPNTAGFNITADTTPPTTTSDVQSSYNQGGVINFTASDDGTLGVKRTYYQLNDGAVQSGDSFAIPSTNGTVEYTLTFWSEDWSGNVESKNTDTFINIDGDGIIRLVWSDSDINPAYAPTDGDSASWTVRVGKWNGTIIATGSSAAPGWDGVDDVSVPVSNVPYYVKVDWVWQGGEESGSYVFQDVYVTEPGQIVRLSY